MAIIVGPIERRGDRRRRAMPSHDIQPQAPQSTWVMRASHEGVRHLVDTSRTGLAQGALRRGWRLVAPVCGELRALALGTLYPVWPASATDGFNTLGGVDESLHGYHGASLAPRVV
jgi:hypothetical protein